jgi:hypothetical protein
MSAFKCQCTINGKTERWKGHIRRFINYGSHYEIDIESRSSIMVVFGKTSRGGFCSIPDFGAGCHLVKLSDKFWNTEKLVSILKKVDGVTVAEALYSLADRITF